MDTDGSIAREFGNVRVTPTTFVIGRDGRVLRRYVGEPNWDEFDRLVERALEN
jgi:protein-disulfide isomerase